MSLVFLKISEIASSIRPGVFTMTLFESFDKGAIILGPVRININSFSMHLPP